MLFKTCIKCKEEKPTSEFHKKKRTSDGLQNMCKQCFKETYKEKKIQADNSPNKKCKVCGEVFSRSDEYFYKSKSSADGLATRCIKCSKESSKRSREANKKYRAGEYISAKALNVPGLTKDKIGNLGLKEGTSYKILTTLKRKQSIEFEGTLISQTDRYIVLRHNKHGYLESFMKVDFFTGERKLKEVV